MRLCRRLLCGGGVAGSCSHSLVPILLHRADARLRLLLSVVRVRRVVEARRRRVCREEQACRHESAAGAVEHAHRTTHTGANGARHRKHTRTYTAHDTRRHAHRPATRATCLLAPLAPRLQLLSSLPLPPCSSCSLCRRVVSCRVGVAGLTGGGGGGKGGRGGLFACEAKGHTKNRGGLERTLLTRTVSGLTNKTHEGTTMKQQKRHHK